MPSSRHDPYDHDPYDLDALMQDKLEAHCRQQLSAMLDGALAPDEARFLLRRLQHDHALAGCWERWQVYGDLMRGSRPALLPADFSQRVVAGLQAEARPLQVAVGQERRHAPVWTRWAGGAALAASVAMATFVVGQRVGGQGGPVETSPAADAPPVAATPQAGATVAPALPQPSAPQPQAPASSAGTLAAATALAVAADAPRRSARHGAAARPADALAAVAGNASPAASRAAATPAATPLETIVPLDLRGTSAVAASAHVHAAAPARDPFTGELPAPRPWPRAVLPGLIGADPGGFNATYGSTAGATDFQPFAPRLPPADGASP